VLSGISLFAQKGQMTGKLFVQEQIEIGKDQGGGLDQLLVAEPGKQEGAGKEVLAPEGRKRRVVRGVRYIP